MFARVIASGVVGLFVALLVMPAIWSDAPWISITDAASCNGASHDIQLSAPNASPRTGTPTTTIVFTVTYRDTGGCKPTSVVVVIPGFGQAAMTTTGTSYGTGVTFRASRRLPVGTWSYRFDATSGSGAGQRSATIAGPGTIVITAPSPTPTPTPKPTPKPTPVPTPIPTPRPTPVPTPQATPSPSARPASPAPTPTPTAHPTPTPSRTASPGSTSSGGTSSPSPGGAGGQGPRSSQAGGTGLIFGRDRPDATEPGGPGGGDPPPGATIGLPGFDIDPAMAAPVAIWFATTTVGVLLFAAVFQGRRLAVELPAELTVFVLKRRRGAAAMSTADGATAPGGAVASSMAAPLAPAGSATAPVPSAAAPGEGIVPTTPGAPTQPAGTTARGPRRFADPPAPGVERRRIAYQSVRVSAGPDELRSAELARLERRDEVEVIGEEGGSIQVRTPDGVEGWVPRVVIIGSPLQERAQPAPEPAPPAAKRRRGIPTVRRGPTSIEPAAEPPRA